MLIDESQARETISEPITASDDHLGLGVRKSPGCSCDQRFGAQRHHEAATMWLGIAILAADSVGGFCISHVCGANAESTRMDHKAEIRNDFQV